MIYHSVTCGGSERIPGCALFLSGWMFCTFCLMLQSPLYLASACYFDCWVLRSIRFKFLRRFCGPFGLFCLCRPLLPLPRWSFAVIVTATTSTSTATVRLSWWCLQRGIWRRNRAYALAALSLFLERRDMSGVGPMPAVSRCINCVAVRDGTVGKYLSCKNYLSNLFFLPILLILGWHMNTMMFCSTNLFLRYI